MSRLLVLILCLLFAAPALAAVPVTATSDDMRYVYEYGDALFHAYQGQWFDAILRLDAAHLEESGGLDGPGPGTAPVVGTGRLVGEFELNYRMDNRAGRAIEAVIESTAKDDLRNQSIYRLARMYFRKDQPKSALSAIDRIRGKIPAAIRSDVAFLRANILMANGRYAEAAAILKGLQDEKKLEGFNAYNLGIALLRSGDDQDGREYLDRAGRTESKDPAVLAIRDKANLVLGEMLLGEKSYEAAKEILDRVRITGPFSDRALLSSGWADASQDQFEQALVPWTLLAGRALSDPAVQEALLAVPYAYSRLGVYSTAALKYEAAQKAFSAEIDKLDVSIASIRQGMFLDAIARADLRPDADWIVNLRSLPETPKTAYLLDLMASNDFQEGLKNYLDLEELRKDLDAWSGDLVAYEELIQKRRAHYEPLLPAIDREYKALRAEQQEESDRRDRLASRLQAMVMTPDPELMVTSDERKMRDQLALLQKLVTPSTKDIAPLYIKRLKRLRGVLYWNMYGEYDQRYADTQNDLRELDRLRFRLDRQFDGFEIVRRTAVESYQGYNKIISREQVRIAAVHKKVLALIEREGKVLEIMAVDELTRRRDRLDELRVKARYGMADSYDRAGKAQDREKGEQ